MDEAIDAANAIASEHMEIVTANPFEVMMKVRNAGAIFIGENSSEPLGDYFAGPNHVLPTNGTAKFFSALSVDDFVKKSYAGFKTGMSCSIQIKAQFDLGFFGVSFDRGFSHSRLPPATLRFQSEQQWS